MPTALLGAFGGGGIFGGLLGKIISFAISSIFQSLFAPDEPEQPEQEGPLLNKRSNTSSIPVVYGTRRIGGNRVFVATDGTKNDTLHVVLLVCEGEIAGFQDIYLDDVLVRFEGKAEGELFTDSTVYPAIGARERQEELVGDEFPLEDTDTFNDLAEFTFHNGGLDQAADTNLSGVLGWSSDHRLRGRAYVYAKLTYDQDTFGSIPSITTNVRGKLVAPISGTTIDDTLANAEYSENPALCLRDYMTNKAYGRGLDTATISDSDIIDSAEYCDVDITLLDSAGATVSSGNRYTLNGIIRTDETLYSNTQSILTHMRGFLVFTSGLYRLRLDRVETSSILYDESNIIGPLSVALGTKKNTLNRMRVTFWNPDKNGEDDTIILDPKVLTSTLTATQLARVTRDNLIDDDNMVFVRDVLDNGVVLSRELQLPYCNSPHVARYVANQEIEQSRQQINITFTTGIAGLQNEVGDIIRVRHNSMGWGYRTVTVDGETILVPNEPLTINNIGQSGLVENFSITEAYFTGEAVTFQDSVFVSLQGGDSNADPVGTPTNVGNTPPAPNENGNAANSFWKQAETFNEIQVVNNFGLIDIDNDGIADNVGIDGKFLYKEFRILALSLQEQEEVELTCMEYDVTVYDNEPLGVVDATPNTSFANPNKIPAVDASTIEFKEELYVTSTSGGVKSSIVFNWDEPNTPFIRAYDVFIHRPEEDWDPRDDYVVGDKVTHNNGRWVATQITGPTSNEAAITITTTAQNINAGVLVSTPDGFFRAIINQTGVTTSTVFTNALFWRTDDGSGAVEPFVGSSHWDQLLTVADEDFLFQTVTTGREFTLLDSKPGTHDIRLRANSVTGVRSPFTTRNDISVLGLIRPPADITGFGLAIEGTLSLLTWTPSTDLDVRIGGSIQVRHNPGVTNAIDFAAQNLDTLWNNSAVLTQGKSGVTSQILTPLLRGVYLMKAIDASGIESELPAAILNEVGSEVQLFPITSINENPTWTGITADADTIDGNDSENLESFDPDTGVADDDQLRLSTLPIWDPVSPYLEGDQVLYNGQVFEVRPGETVGEPLPGAQNTTPEGENISDWGLISQRGSIASEQWQSATRNTLTNLDIPAFTDGTYYFSNDIVFDAVESQEIAPIITFIAQNIGGTVDNLDVPIDDLITSIDELGDPNASAGTSVRMEISTTNTLGTFANIPDNEWSGYTTFTEGSYNFRAARFRISIVTTTPGTQVTISEAGIRTNLPARTINNIIDLAWTATDATSPGFEDVIYETASGSGSSFHGGGGSSISGASEPAVSIVAENIFPGEYFVLTNRDAANPTTTNIENGQEADAPLPNAGFRIRFFRVQNVDVCTNQTCTTTASVPGSPQIGLGVGDDPLISNKTLNFDYQAQGY